MHHNFFLTGDYEKKLKPPVPDDIIGVKPDIFLQNKSRYEIDEMREIGMKSIAQGEGKII